ncbi:cysteine hydrolase family protein [Streptomyces sp. NBC_00306]|uniref:cysteine hydrolase family protein n=1 Tax=Streptomyces sp. NBC_00306 TaxID=2975708 RepID=UPI002E2BCF16|nr:cysteine hydrolase [Streptomyces sp. NBC_00306]
MQENEYPPGCTGLLLIDTVNEVFAENGKGYPQYKEEFERIGVVENLKSLLAGARRNGLHIFFSGMSYSDDEYRNWRHKSGIHQAMFESRLFEQGTWAVQFHPDFTPGPGEVALAPHKNIDVFMTTDLDTQLQRRGVEYLAIAGMIGSMCVESTGRGAMERGYHVTMLKDATASDGGKQEYDSMVGRYPLFAHSVLTVDEYLAAVEKSTGVR